LVSGEFFNYSKRSQLDYANLLDMRYDYLLLTNEHNTDMTLDIESREYLKTIREYSFWVNGKLFFTKVIKVIK